MMLGFDVHGRPFPDAPSIRNAASVLGNMFCDVFEAFVKDRVFGWLNIKKFNIDIDS